MKKIRELLLAAFIVTACASFASTALADPRGPTGPTGPIGPTGSIGPTGPASVPELNPSFVYAGLSAAGVLLVATRVRRYAKK